MAKNLGTMEFCLRDYRETEFNESIDCTFDLYGEGDEVLSIEKYYLLCKQFGAAMGFAKETIDEWFGTY